MPHRALFSYLRAGSACLAILLLLSGCQYLGKGGKSEPALTTSNPCIVLALPASGNYATFASRIRRGAEQARLEMQRAGATVRIENINTEAPDWLTRLSALPPMCAIVGGPLQEKKYLQAKQAGLLQQRAFFAFVPTLQKGEEGQQAWRFFPSPQDQIDALVEFTTDQMNIRTYGAFYPNDNYGRRMSEMLEQTLAGRHISLQKAAYNPKAPDSWVNGLKPLINPKLGEDGKTPLPQTMFEAIFVPDSWKNMDMITTSLLYNGEDRLALLGTTLWEQGLAGKQIPKAERFALAVFPAVWNKNKAPQALAGAGNDFWTALGYDFVNFAGRVALAMRPEAHIVTSLAQKAAPAVRGMAPIYWDSNGIAHQRLYLFQVTPSGMAPVNPERFRQARQAAAERAALRMQGFNNIDPLTGQTMPEGQQSNEPELPPVQMPEAQAMPVANQIPQDSQLSPAAPVQINQGNISTVPHTSYKLSLPVKK